MSDSSSHSNHVPSRLMRESLVDRDVIAGTESPVVRILPHINVIQIGGRIMDRGRDALLPLLNEIVENQAHHTQVIAVGAGIRSRHIFAVGLDLGLPTGVLATLSAKDAAQNAYMVSCLLAKHGFVYLEAPFVVQLLPAMLAAARGAVFNGVPPYDLWEHPPEIGRIPPHRTDSGPYMVAEVFGAKRMIFVKDVDGLYTSDPAVEWRKGRVHTEDLRFRPAGAQPYDPAARSDPARPAAKGQVGQGSSNNQRSAPGNSDPRFGGRAGGEHHIFRLGFHRGGG